MTDYHTRTIRPADADVWRRTGHAVPIDTGPLEDCHGWIASAEACTEIGAEEDFGAIRGALSWPGLLSAAVVIVAMLSAVFWPH